ncbi:MAG TPA: hypothetical protein P5065_06885 [Candidatus Ratteibacteria bacterium]|jgi:pyruvate/2-oxoglutarate dehydrogenase complex dihydrolipoamide acyltransferase (E2) component|uniref:Dihydrolipoyllysine-residue acetyltransferase component of pyruvate dehydrogenase complex n=1 Tax=candidate division TA06 bacterium ADurb.Bin131 TaxID=1852827 RepID=A0A1V6C7Q3_UNCT6|nr:MAG: Dihydrolipoyllysine-residue acetyltransferase component of pyruvate dehydrogenase complex [candidate division TA06 bacterium ADurb.Bin131]HOC03569.1 hypothetical protein [bacterium]HRS06747.1 hypothetical protein [Candidatus Ratteibacteria bacterium]HON06220.1 hypothetical protein [bacterium]HPC30013.1 hypothetical protein [bacterium]
MKKKILAAFEGEIEKASISFWYVKEGDTIEKDKPLVEFVTDKTSFTYVSPFDCKIVKIFSPEGDDVLSGQEIAEVEII